MAMALNLLRRRSDWLGAKHRRSGSYIPGTGQSKLRIQENAWPIPGM